MGGHSSLPLTTAINTSNDASSSSGSHHPMISNDSSVRFGSTPLTSTPIVSQPTQSMSIII